MELPPTGYPYPREAEGTVHFRSTVAFLCKYPHKNQQQRAHSEQAREMKTRTNVSLALKCLQQRQAETHQKDICAHVSARTEPRSFRGKFIPPGRQNLGAENDVSQMTPDRTLRKRSLTISLDGELNSSATWPRGEKVASNELTHANEPSQIERKLLPLRVSSH